MARYIWITAGVLIVIIAIAMGRQHAYYADIRKTVVQDHQNSWYSGDSFHAFIFLKSTLSDPTAEQTIEELRAFKTATSGLGDAKWIYAGKVVVNGWPSGQIGDIPWSSAILVQYPSKDAYQEAAASEAYQKALAAFEMHYTHGTKRSALQNLMFPQLMLATRLGQGFGGIEGYPFEPADPTRLSDQARNIVDSLRAEGELGRDAIAVFNLIKPGTPEQEAANAEYVAPMVGLMAHLSMGPMHFASTDPLTGHHDFDTAGLVYYPGTDFFADMISSTFYQNILSDKQLGDTQATITVPVLDLL